MKRTLATLGMLLALGAAAAAADPKMKEPGPKARGKTYQWKAEDGLGYWYYVPKKYDPEKGANLTVILHGSNLKAGWGFWNHKAGAFRPDDIVVSPDGTTPNGRGGFNFLDGRKDAKRFHALLVELKKTFKIHNTFLYGHSQGSFFACHYIGAYPEDVAGVVAHASGVWTHSQKGSKGHDIAIVMMHGTADPVVPYGNSVGGYHVYREARYPLVRLRSLEGWNHWPAEHNGPVPHTSQQLAWVEGMTTTDMGRLATCFDVLATVKDTGQHDYAGLYTLAKRIIGLDGAPDGLKQRAAKAMAGVEDLAAAHIRALSIPEKAEFKRGPWVAHLPRFLRSFMDLPARDELAAEWEDVLDEHKKDAIAHLRKYYAALRKGKQADAFKEGVAAVTRGFLWHECQDPEFRKKMKELRKLAKKIRASKKAIKGYDAIFPDFEKSIKDSYRAYEAVNRKSGKL